MFAVSVLGSLGRSDALIRVPNSDLSSTSAQSLRCPGLARYSSLQRIEAPPQAYIDVFHARMGVRVMGADDGTLVITIK